MSLGEVYQWPNQACTPKCVDKLICDERVVFQPPSLFASAFCACINENVNLSELEHVYSNLNHKEDISYITEALIAPRNWAYQHSKSNHYKFWSSKCVAYRRGIKYAHPVIKTEVVHKSQVNVIWSEARRVAKPVNRKRGSELCGTVECKRRLFQ